MKGKMLLQQGADVRVVCNGMRECGRARYGAVGERRGMRFFTEKNSHNTSFYVFGARRSFLLSAARMGQSQSAVEGPGVATPPQDVRVHAPVTSRLSYCPQITKNPHNKIQQASCELVHAIVSGQSKHMIASSQIIAAIINKPISCPVRWMYLVLNKSNLITLSSSLTLLPSASSIT